MRAQAGFLILLGLLIITGTVSASVADISSTIGTSKEWVIANNHDASVITVVAKNNTYVPPLINNAVVTFTVNDGKYGSLTASSVKTDINGVATTSFITKTKSGTAVITATITSADQYGAHTEILTLDQKIDHNQPQFAKYDNPAKLTVGNISVLNLTVTDIYGNRIDSRNPAEKHTFNLYMPGELGRGLWDGSGFVPTINVANTDEYGNITVKFRVAYVAMFQTIYMDVIGNMVSPEETWIEGVAEDEPIYLFQVYPTPNDLPADDTSKFGFYYFVYDRYMNPVNNSRVHIEASDGTIFDEVTNTLGSAFVYFGPKDTASTYTITATAVDNSSGGAFCLEPANLGTCIQEVTFHNTAPVDLIVTANPMSMASLDVDDTSHGLVQARVVDIKGNAVVGENVSFSLGAPSYDYPYAGATAPSISPTEAKTGVGTFATTVFIPGAFATTGTNFNATATGWATVTATWTNVEGTITKSKDVTFYWKNYPYLSTKVPPEVCEKVKVGDKVNLSLSLFGDGAALRPKPIDVVLIIDRSGSMAGSKITQAKAAATTFVENMSDGNNQAGLVSFATTTTMDQSLTNDFPLVESKIAVLSASGSTQMRTALYQAITDVRDNGRGNAVKAVILLTDGDWNQEGSIIGHLYGWPANETDAYTFSGSTNEPNNYRWYDGRGGTLQKTAMGHWRCTDGEFTEQNMSIYAKDSGVRIYALSFVSSPGAYVKSVLHITANNTGGFYEHAADATQLNSLYTRIAGELIETAGGETVVTLDFGTVNINDNPANNLTEYMDYEYVHPYSFVERTDSTYYNKTKVNATSGGLDLIYQGVRNDAANWSAKLMKFDVGTIKLNEGWMTSFRVNLTKAGKIQLFGPTSSSQICFKDASTGKVVCQKIQPFVCNIQEKKTDIPFTKNILILDNLTRKNDGPDPNIHTIKWNTTYLGGAEVTETVSYRNNDIPNSHFMPVPDGIIVLSSCFEETSIMTIDTTDWPAGHYTIQIVGVAPDAANPGAIETSWTKQAPDTRKYIKLE
jgi:hypothetical protein